MDFTSIIGFSLQQALGPTAILLCLAAIGLNTVSYTHLTLPTKRIV